MQINGQLTIIYLGQGNVNTWFKLQSLEEGVYNTEESEHAGLC